MCRRVCHNRIKEDSNLDLTFFPESTTLAFLFQNLSVICQKPDELGLTVALFLFLLLREPVIFTRQFTPTRTATAALRDNCGRKPPLYKLADDDFFN